MISPLGVLLPFAAAFTGRSDRRRSVAHFFPQNFLKKLLTGIAAGPAGRMRVSAILV
jgi:hypothetical protein